ncbi:MAG: S41 family peptidase [Clostridiaceae bacterium]
MKHSASKRFFTAVSVLFMLAVAGCGQASASQTSTAPTPTPLAPSEIAVSAEDCALDAEELIATLERTHPLFLAEPYPEAYLSAREAFLASVPACQTQADFRLVVSLYLNSLNDGHTGVRRQSNAFAPSYAQIRVAALGSDLFLLDDNGQLTSAKVTAVGGIPVAELFALVDAYFPAENQTAKDANHSKRMLNCDLLALAGCALTEDTVTVAIDEGGQTREESVSFGEEPLLRANYYSEDTVASCETMGDVFYLDFNECDKGAALNAVCRQLKIALREGVSRVIIDARDNPGGNSDACEQILSAMGMGVPSYGVVRRNSPLANEQRGYGRKDGFVEYSRSLDGAKQNPDVSLIVLVNDGTFSSATMLAVWVQDGKLGQVVGYPSANAPTSFGDILTFTLPRTGIEVVMSHKQFQRPDASANQTTLAPDVLVPYGEDALPVALALLG